MYDQNGKTRYPVYDQNGWETKPFRAAGTYIAHITEYPPGFNSKLDLFGNEIILGRLITESQDRVT